MLIRVAVKAWKVIWSQCFIVVAYLRVGHISNDTFSLDIVANPDPGHFLMFYWLRSVISLYLCQSCQLKYPLLLHLQSGWKKYTDYSESKMIALPQYGKGLIHCIRYATITMHVYCWLLLLLMMLDKILELCINSNNGFAVSRTA